MSAFPGYRPKTLAADGREYGILARAAASVGEVSGLVLEIGCRLGGGIETIIAGLGSAAKGRTIISVDPYGDIPYAPGKGHHACSYSNNLKLQAMEKIAPFCRAAGVNWQPFFMRDTDYFVHFGVGVPVYGPAVQRDSPYALVHVDGPHTEYDAGAALAFFRWRMAPGGVIVFDDIDSYDHAGVDAALVDRVKPAYEVLERGRAKVAYRREK